MTTTPLSAATRAPATPPRQSRARVGRGLLRVLPVVALVLLWIAVTEAKLWDEVIVPRPITVWDAFVQSMSTHNGQRGLSGYYLWEHLWASLGRILKGVFWGTLLGIAAGLALGSIRPIRIAFEPLLNFVRSLPPLAYFSLLIIWFGIDDSSKVWLLFLAAFPPVAIATMAGVDGIKPERINAARSLGANRRQVLVHTVLPSSLPDIFTGTRLAVGFAWTTVVAAETSNGIPGIGGLAWSTKKELRTDVAIMCVIVIGLTAVALDLVVRTAERFIVPWKGKS